MELSKILYYIGMSMLAFVLSTAIFLLFHLLKKLKQEINK